MEQKVSAPIMMGLSKAGYLPEPARDLAWHQVFNPEITGYASKRGQEVAPCGAKPRIRITLEMNIVTDTACRVRDGKTVGGVNVHNNQGENASCKADGMTDKPANGLTIRLN